MVGILLGMTELGLPPVPTGVREEIRTRVTRLREGGRTQPLVLAGNHRGVLARLAELAGEDVRVLRPAANAAAARRTLSSVLGDGVDDGLVELSGPASELLVPIIASVAAAGVEVGPVVEKALDNRGAHDTVLPELVRDVLATAAADAPTIVVLDAVDEPSRRLLWDLATITLGNRVDGLAVIVGTEGPASLEADGDDDPLSTEPRVQRQIRLAVQAGAADRLWFDPLDAARATEWMGDVEDGTLERLLEIADGDDIAALRFWTLWSEAGHVTRDGDRWVTDPDVPEPVGADIDAVIEAQSIPEEDRATTRVALRLAATCGAVFSGSAVFAVAAAEAGVERDDVEDLLDLVTPDGSSTERWLVRSVDHVKVGRASGATETHWRYLFGSPDHQRLLRSEIPAADRTRVSAALLAAAVRAHGTNPPYLSMLAGLARAADHPIDAGRLMSAADAEADVRLVRVRGRLLLDATTSDVPIAAIGEQLITGARALLNVGAAADAELLARAVLDLDEGATNDLVRGGARRMLGVARREQGDLDEAVRHLLAAADEQRDRLEEQAEDRHRRGLAAALFDLGVARRQKGELDDAITDLAEAVELLVAVGGTEDEGPAGAASARDLAMARRNLGVAQRDRGDLDDALVSLGDAVSSLRELTERQPTALHQRELVAALRSLGSAQRRTGGLAEAITSLEDAAARGRAVALASRTPNDIHELGHALHDLGVAQREHGAVGESVASLTLSQRFFADLVKNHRTKKYERDLANVTRDLDGARRRNGKSANGGPAAPASGGGTDDGPAGDDPGTPGTDV